MELDENPIKEFVKKHEMGWRDEYMQAGVVVEEAIELKEAVLQYGGYQTMTEAADVIIAVMVLAELKGWSSGLPELVAEKMRENLRKPVGRKVGEKVRKA
ncbi:hypothetical protein KAX02_03560 [candidate division WOR-3 bacterium]|nr:hypothetical protein [candidate division WOR-3 bacterium]